MPPITRSLITLILIIFVFGLPTGQSAAQQPGPVFTLNPVRGELNSNIVINQSVTISLTRSATIIESATSPAPFYTYQFQTLPQPGDQITLTAGATVLYDTVVIPINLVVDLANAQIRGQAFPGQEVRTTFHTYTVHQIDTINKCWDKGGSFPYDVIQKTSAAPDGSFTLTSPVGLRPGDTGLITIYDAAGNQQIHEFNTGDTLVLNIQARVFNGKFFSSIPNLSSVNITINQANGTFIWSNNASISNPYDVEFYQYIPQSVPLLPGEIVTVTDGVKMKQMVIPRITLDRLIGSQVVTGRVEIPGSDAAPSGYLVTGWYEDQLFQQTGHCLEGPVTQGVINVPFNIKPFAARDVINLSYEDGNGNFLSNRYQVNSLITIKDQIVPGYGIFTLDLELQNAAFTLDHYRAGQVIGSYSGITDVWGGYTINSGPDVIAQAGDRVVVSAGSETLIDVTVPDLGAVVDPLKNQVSGQVTSQAPNLVPMMAYLERKNGMNKTIYHTTRFASNLDGSFLIQPQASETWVTPLNNLPGRPFKVDACTQIPALYSLVPGGHAIVWIGPDPANVSPDAYEPDGAAQTARPYFAPQRHTLLTGSDEDWVSFEISPSNTGKPIIFAAQDMGWGMVVDLTLYKVSNQGAQALTTQTLNELGQHSFLYTFTTPGVYQARIRGQSGSGYTFGGCDSAYTLFIQSPAPLHSSTHLDLTGSLPPAIYPGQVVTLHFDLAPTLPNGPLPGGALTISENPAGGSPICQASVSGTRVDCTLTFSTSGSYSLTASYSGDDLYDPSSLPGIALTVSPISTATNLSIAPLSPETGQPVVLTATVAAQFPGGMTPVGTITFYDNTERLGGPVALADGAAHLDLAGLPVGPHKLFATYSGDASFSASQSPVLELTIEPVVYFSYIPVVVQGALFH